MPPTSNPRELKQGRAEWKRYYDRVLNAELSRRTIMRGSTALALLSSGGLAALLDACGGNNNKGASQGGRSTPTGSTGSWDSTGTPPYKQGIPDPQANAPADWKAFPWVY